MTERSVLEQVLAGRASAERIRRQEMYGFIARRITAREQEAEQKAERRKRQQEERSERRRIARASGARRPATREYLLGKYGCVWPGCQEMQARYAHAYREPVRPSAKFGDAPLCERHLHRAWVAAEDAVEWQREMDSIDEAGEAVDINARADFEWRPAGRVDRSPRTRRPGSIYYLRCDGYIKIGYASKLVNRLKQYPPTIELLAVRPGTQAEEAAEHSLLQEHRAWRREWYHPTPALMRHVAEVAEQWGVGAEEVNPEAFSPTQTTPL